MMLFRKYSPKRAANAYRTKLCRVLGTPPYALAMPSPSRKKGESIDVKIQREEGCDEVIGSTGKQRRKKEEVVRTMVIG